MKNLKVSAKLMLGFLTITLISMVLSGIGIFSAMSINGNYTYLVESPIAREKNLRNIQLGFMGMRYRTANFVMNSGDAEMINGTLLPQFNDSYSMVETNIEEYIKNCNSDTRRDASVISTNLQDTESLKGMFTEYNKIKDQVLALALSGDAAGADVVLKSAIALSGQMNELVSKMLTPASEYVAEQDGAMDVYANTVTFVQIGITVAALALALFLAFYISNLISKPLTYMRDVLHQMGKQGVANFSDEEYRQAEAYASAKDETGESITMLIATGRRLEAVGKELEKVAGGDLTADISLLSDRDTIGQSLQKMIVNLNGMFDEIRNSTSQVSTGTKQIADGAQALAQGSTQQAEAVEQLSSSISAIASKTKVNAEMAGKAATLADSIKKSAEKGSHQMDQMMEAVKEINQASQSINKVISVIDNIAFQTNILALNAAVEAARAGQHGKGFAVVAEEVRSLASKSAEAAKETGTLIANSMEKAELGARIADETAASLVEIVSGINESSMLMGDISRSSDEQSEGISQINRGIDQVAHVVQQNSATAEESAAASEEMSSQSTILEELISQFKIKNSGSTRSLPAANKKSKIKQLAMPEKTVYAPVDNGDFGKY